MDFILEIAILIFSVIIHEVSHGYAALLLGDKTAQYAGRLTLNPIKHLDPLGSVILPLFLAITRSPIMLAWAKPVPFNPYNLRDQKRGPAIVGAAGPMANFALAFSFGMIGILLPIEWAVKQNLYLNFLQSLFGSVSPFSAGTNPLETFYLVSLYIVWLNVILMMFNLVPIPPLDGSRILFTFLPYRWHKMQMFLEQYGFFVLLVFLLFFSGVLFHPVLFLFRILSGAV